MLKKVLGSLGAAVILSVAAAPVGAQSATESGASVPDLVPDDWTTYRNSGPHGGWDQTETTLTRSNVRRLAPQWSFPVSGMDIVEQAGAVGHGLLVTGVPGGLAAFDAATGARRWRSPGGPSVVIGQQLIFSITSDPAVVALDPATGDVRWRTPVPGRWTNAAQALRPPTLAGGCVLVSGVEEYDAPTGLQLRAVLACVSTATHKIAWRTVLRGDAFSASAPSTDGETAFVSTNLQYVVAVDIATGKVRWQYDSRSRAVGTSTPMPVPVIRDGRVLVGFGDGHFEAIDAVTGRSRWSTQLCDGPIWTTAASADGRAFVTCGRSGPASGASPIDLYALAEAGGRVLWSIASGHATSSPGVANGVIYLGTRTATGNQLRAYATGTGRELGTWSVPGPGGDYSPMPEVMVSHGKVYVATASAGRVFALRP